MRMLVVKFKDDVDDELARKIAESVACKHTFHVKTVDAYEISAEDFIAELDLAKNRAHVRHITTA